MYLTVSLVTPCFRITRSYLKYLGHRQIAKLPNCRVKFLRNVLLDDCCDVNFRDLSVEAAVASAPMTASSIAPSNLNPPLCKCWSETVSENSFGRVTQRENREQQFFSETKRSKMENIWMAEFLADLRGYRRGNLSRNSFHRSFSLS
jgi:hypothetical protein